MKENRDIETSVSPAVDRAATGSAFRSDQPSPEDMARLKRWAEETRWAREVIEYQSVVGENSHDLRCDCDELSGVMGTALKLYRIVSREFTPLQPNESR